ncbi:MAG TPA: hypothetical protein VEB21_18605 [Terriglobales bacterium]|nr:hypothetical protein [Terriglobales bacterium]
MSMKKGDKARFNRERRKKTERRALMRALRAAAGQPQTTPATEAERGESQ